MQTELKCSHASLTAMIEDIEQQPDAYRDEGGLAAQRAALAALRFVQGLIDEGASGAVGLAHGDGIVDLFDNAVADLDPEDKGYADLNRAAQFVASLPDHWWRTIAIERVFDQMKV